jgi:hypothetical protein
MNNSKCNLVTNLTFQSITVASYVLTQYVILRNSLLPSYTPDFCLIPPLLPVRRGPAYSQVCCRLFWIKQLNQAEFWPRWCSLRQLRWRFWKDRLGVECLVSKHIFGLYFLKFLFDCIHLHQFRCVLAVLSSNLTFHVIPGAAIIKFLTFICCFLALPGAFVVCVLNQTKNSEIL